MIISTCIITYNQDKYIEKCIKGALEQKLDATYEIVIGDDSSTDQTSDICGFYAKEYPELIKYIRAEKNVGMNRNWIIQLKIAAENTLHIVKVMITGLIRLS